MKKHTIRFRVVDKSNFDDIKNGTKSIETRAATEKYRRIQTGDVFIIVCGRNRITKKIKTVKHFRSVTSLVKAVGLKKIMPDVKTIVEAKRRWYGYPGYEEKIKKFGLMAFELK